MLHVYKQPKLLKTLTFTLSCSTGPSDRENTSLNHREALANVIPPTKTDEITIVPGRLLFRNMGV